MKKLIALILKLFLSLTIIFNVLLEPKILNSNDDNSLLKIEYEITEIKDVYTDKIEINLTVIENIENKFSGIDEIYYVSGEYRETIYKADYLTTYFNRKLIIDVKKIYDDKITIYATDKAGNIAIKNIEGIIVDKNIPKINTKFDFGNIKIKDGKAYIRDMPKLKYKILDDNIDEVIIDNKNVKNYEDDIYFDDGEYSSIIKVKDMAGNKVEKNFLQEYDVDKFVVDTKPPLINIIKPKNKIYVKNSYVVEVEIQDDNIDYELLDKRYFWTNFDNKVIGTYIIKDGNDKIDSICVYDKAGNRSDKAIEEINFDNFKPKVHINNYKKYMNIEDSFDINFFDENIDIENSMVKMIVKDIYESGNLIKSNSGLKINMDKFGYGKYILDVSIKDKADNETLLQKEIYVIKEKIDYVIIRKNNIPYFTNHINNIDTHISIKHPFNIVSAILLIDKDGERVSKNVDISNNEVYIKLGNDYLLNQGKYIIDLILTDEIGVKEYIHLADFIFDITKPSIKVESDKVIVSDNEGLSKISIYYRNFDKFYECNGENKRILSIDEEAIFVEAEDLSGNKYISFVSPQKSNDKNYVKNVSNNYLNDEFVYLYTILYLINYILFVYLRINIL